MLLLRVLRTARVVRREDVHLLRPRPERRRRAARARRGRAERLLGDGGRPVVETPSR